MSGLYCIEAARRGLAVAWCAPTYKNSRPLWRLCESIVNPSVAKINKAEREIEFPSRGRLAIYSADNPISMRGENFDVVVVDEAARVPESVYTEVLLPTIADRDGGIMLISTPCGKNWFYREFVRAKSFGAAWQAPTRANPLPHIQRAALLARERVPQRIYQQEWEAQFVDDGSLFVNIEACATAISQDGAQDGHTYVIGVDWARVAGGDFTVFVVLDVTTRAVAHIVRLQGMPFDRQLSRLIDLYRRFNYPVIVAEQNALGMPLIEQLQSAELPVVPFLVTASSKHNLISALALAFERREIAIINDQVLIDELMTFEMRARSGIPSYGAPPGLHDDCVMALALAYSQISSENWLIS